MSGPGGLLMLDLATVTGWCYGLPSARPVSGAKRFQVEGLTDGEFHGRFQDWLNDMIATMGPSVIAYEAPFVRTAGDRAVARLFGMSTIVDLVAYRHSKRCFSVNLHTIKKYWTGDGHAKKADMILRCKALGFEPRDDNEADAIAGWHYGIDELRSMARARKR